MKRLCWLEKMGCSGHLLIDGTFKIPLNSNENYAWQQTTLIKGDLRCSPISAASIVAKSARDQLMRDLSERFPGYGFETHKGYGSAFHRKAIARLGPCETHRKTFGGVKEHCRARTSLWTAGDKSFSKAGLSFGSTPSSNPFCWSWYLNAGHSSLFSPDWGQERKVFWFFVSPFDTEAKEKIAETLEYFLLKVKGIAIRGSQSAGWDFEFAWVISVNLGP